MFQYLLEFVHDRAFQMSHIKPPLLNFRYKIWVGKQKFLKTEGPSAVGSFQFHEEADQPMIGPYLRKLLQRDLFSFREESWRWEICPVDMPPVFLLLYDCSRCVFHFYFVVSLTWGCWLELGGKNYLYQAFDPPFFRQKRGNDVEIPSNDPVMGWD